MNVLLNDETIKFLHVRRLPGQLTAPQTAALLGFLPHDMAVLVKRKLLRPLGKPQANATRYFAARDIERLSSDSAWLSKATQTMSEHWQLGKSPRPSTNSDDL